MTRQKVFLVAGARPNFMKIAPIYWAVEEAARDALEVEIVHTGQHYDATLSDSFFRDLRLPPPDVNLGVGSASHAEQTARVMIGFERALLERRPDVVVVVGDVNSTAACALVASKIEFDGGTSADSSRRRPVLVHVEAGLRSRDRSMPEEVNRIVTDALSDALFTTCRDAEENLLAEGTARDKIRFVGNPMIDSLRRCLDAAARCPLLEDVGLEGRAFGLCTLHRPSNVDQPASLGEILDTLRLIADDVPVLLPLHPRTRARVEAFGLADRLVFLQAGERAPQRGIIAREPLSYLEMLRAMQQASFILTDSGGVQEETTALGVACVTLRDNTERPVTIAEGTNVLARATRDGILTGLTEARRKASNGHRIPELWDGRAGGRIVAGLVELARGH